MHSSDDLLLLSRAEHAQNIVGQARFLDLALDHLDDRTNRVSLLAEIEQKGCLLVDLKDVSRG